MKISSLKKRLSPNRPMTTISMRVPADVIEDLKKVAPLLGFSGYQPLIRAYVGQGLRQDLDRLQTHPAVEKLVRQLEERGVSPKLISRALAEAQLKRSA